MHRYAFIMSAVVGHMGQILIILLFIFMMALPATQSSQNFQYDDLALKYEFWGSGSDEKIAVIFDVDSNGDIVSYYATEFAGNNNFYHIIYEDRSNPDDGKEFYPSLEVADFVVVAVMDHNGGGDRFDGFEFRISVYDNGDWEQSQLIYFGRNSGDAIVAVFELDQPSSEMRANFVAEREFDNYDYDSCRYCFDDTDNSYSQLFYGFEDYYRSQNTGTDQDFVAEFAASGYSFPEVPNRYS